VNPVPPDLVPEAPVRPVSLPVSLPVSMPPGTVMVDGGEDVNPDDDTAPIPVITPDMPNPARVAADPPVSRIRAPFEPPERKSADSAPPPPPLDPEAVLPVDVKLDQIKDLYLTAEAIGEDALTQHFEQVSERQRQLIKEYFDQVAARGGPDEAMS
jgi:hypothetical protein